MEREGREARRERKRKGHGRERDFVYDQRHHTTQDSGPIGLSLMVTVSQLWTIHTMNKAIKIAKERKFTRPRIVKI